MTQALIAAFVVGAISFGIGELFAVLLGRHSRRVRRRYLPAIVTFVMLFSLYAFVGNLGRG